MGLSEFFHYNLMPVVAGNENSECGEREPKLNTNWGQKKQPKISIKMLKNSK